MYTVTDNSEPSTEIKNAINLLIRAIRNIYSSAIQNGNLYSFEHPIKTVHLTRLYCSVHKYNIICANNTHVFYMLRNILHKYIILLHFVTRLIIAHFI